MLSRRLLFALATVLPIALSAQKKTGALLPLDLSNPDDALVADQRIQCSTDSSAVTYWWQGTLWSRIEGERDRMLFRFQAMNTRACASFNDPQKGRGYRMVSRELVFYTDPTTGQVLRTWTNPWTGKDTEVMHVSNDPVNMRETSWARGPNGPYKMTNLVEKDGKAFMSSIVPLFYVNPLAGDYQESVGGFYHAMELFNFFAPMAQLTDRSLKTVPDVQIQWSRVSGWLPWMNMGSRDGLIIYNSQGKKLASWDALPDVMKQEIALNYPEYTKPPALDDTRANETSWTYFKKWKAKRAGVSR